MSGAATATSELWVRVVLLGATNAEPDASLLTSAAGRVLLIVVVAVVLVVLGLWAKRLFLGDRRAPAIKPSPAFGLADLRRLREEGKLTDDEFERARDRLVAAEASRVAGPTTDERTLAEGKHDDLTGRAEGGR